MMILKVLCKQFFGAKYERVGKSLAACLILFLAIRAAEIRMEIAPLVLFLTATALSAGIMWQTLHDAGNVERMMGLFMLPFQDREMTVSLVLAFTCYTLVTKTFPVLALFFALQKWNVLQIAVSLLCACIGCFAAAAWYAMTKEAAHPEKSKRKALFADAYVFYCQVSTKKIISHSKGRGSIFLYLLRYLLTNRHYLWNTVGLCVLGGILPMILGQFDGLYVMPLGFAILCLNTPICILLSCDPDLEQAVRVLPGQAARFCSRYTLFLFSVNLAINSVYLISWQMQLGGVGSREVLIAALIALQSAVLSVCMEWFFPIRGWKMETDLWHHPRKYIVPLSMLLLAGLIGMWPTAIWVLFGVVLPEILILSFHAERT